MARSSVPVWVELTCAYCGDSTQGQHVTGPLNGIKLPMIRAAKAEGWVFVAGKGYCSKEHQALAAARRRKPQLAVAL
jgi:hypothetical protein